MNALDAITVFCSFTVSAWLSAYRLSNRAMHKLISRSTHNEFEVVPLKTQTTAIVIVILVICVSIAIYYYAAFLNTKTLTPTSLPNTVTVTPTPTSLPNSLTVAGIRVQVLSVVRQNTYTIGTRTYTSTSFSDDFIIVQAGF